ncbi:MAG: hypothetical protein HOO91_02810 [Bacteroidales bacterium]|nr:hypothetical protein [Bacteroidales bacterium]
MGLNNDKILVFKNAFESKCFQLIVGAYNNVVVDKSISLNLEENDISAILHHNITLNPLSIKWQIFSKTENYIYKENRKIEKGFASKQSRIDFVFSVFHTNLRFEYFIEAKNLNENDSALKRRYIDTGINSYISKKYENGSLVGYLIEGNLDLTISGINSLLKKDGRNTEVLQRKTFKLHKDYFESEHKEVGVLKHLIFEFANNL